MQLTPHTGTETKNGMKYSPSPYVDATHTPHGDGNFIPFRCFE